LRNFLPLTLVAMSLSACSMLSGPSSSTLEELARNALIASAGNDPAGVAAAKAAKIETKGLCNSQAEKDTYVCGIEVTGKMPGDAQEGTRTLIVKAKKNASGKWVSVD
jgi:hypothetical protein